MNNSMIGMYGKYDGAKYDRDFVRGFYGVEACMFPSIDDVRELVNRAQADHFCWGAHYPLLRNDRATRDPLFISLDGDTREQAFADFEKEAALASQYGGQYLLTHFPKPVLISDSFNLTYWRFASDREWMYEKDYPVKEMDNNLHNMFMRLERIAKEHRIQVILENDAIPQHLVHSSVLTELFETFSGIKACLDVGRLHLQQMADSKFNGMDFASKLSPYTALVHLWNASPEQNLAGGHLPVSARQKKEDGFADVRAYLEVIFANTDNVRVLFEHNSDIITDEELKECYTWVDAIQKGNKKGNNVLDFM